MMSAQENETLSDLFGSYKAEWLQGRVFEFFTEPSYFPELRQNNPCVLVGGRGTGKTTVLRGLSYEGEWELKDRPQDFVHTLRFVGIYHRIDTNRVTAFQGLGLDERDWQRYFAHYINLILSELIVKFLVWIEDNCGVVLTFTADNIATIQNALHFGSFANVRELLVELRQKKLAFESMINNLDADQVPLLTLQGAPLEALLGIVWQNEFLTGKQFFFLIDEYENLLDSQQQVINTLIKHTTPLYTFKIGVREEGWRCRTALNSHEVLISPADYILISIESSLHDTFKDFTTKACNARLQCLEGSVGDVRALLPSLSLDKEAEMLGVLERVKDNIEQICEATSVSAEQLLVRHSALDIYFIASWAQSKELDFMQCWNDFQTDPATWKDRLGNNRYSMLFSINQGKVGIRKYYCGWDTYVLMSNLNIRYIMQLVHQSLLAHENSGKNLSEPISFEIQTKTAQNVGKKNLTELEGLSTKGNSLVKILLGLGRVFQIMARHPAGHTPELNQFHINQDSDSNCASKVDAILKEGVMHLAFVRIFGTKLLQPSDIRSYDYMLHPIYSAFFEYSHRRKRKLEISDSLFLDLIDRPTVAIESLLLRSKRSSRGAQIPEQMSLLESFYDHD
jgi:hypothetical protein